MGTVGTRTASPAAARFADLAAVRGNVNQNAIAALSIALMTGPKLPMSGSVAL